MGVNTHYIAVNTTSMTEESQNYQNAKKMLEALIGLNKAIAAEQYRLLNLKRHDRKNIKIVLFYYLN